MLLRHCKIKYLCPLDIAIEKMRDIREFHLFSGIGGGIYGGHILKHICCGGVEIDPYCQKVLKQKQADGWMNPFPIYDDIRTLHAKPLVMLLVGKILKKKTYGQICSDL